MVIIDKATLTLVNRVELDNFFSFHFSNGYADKEGNIVVDHCEYNNEEVLFKFTKQIVAGDIRDVNYTSSFVRLTVDPVKGKLISRQVLYDKNCDFPTILPELNGKPYQNVFLSNVSKSSEMINKVANLNLEKQSAVERDFGDYRYVGESLHIPSEINKLGYIINVVYNAQNDKSEVHLMNADNLEDQAVIELPQAIPFGYHGTWQNRL
jgi:carotenoid cleavage dioxygenase